MEETREGLAKYRSFGEMLASDPKFSDRKRNRDNDYLHTAKRSDLEDEVRKIFQAQRCFGNAHATEELERQFRNKAFSQRPLQDSEGKVGNCPFEPDHKRTAKRAPSFELFRFLQRLVNLRIAVGRAERSLRPEEIGLVLKNLTSRRAIPTRHCARTSILIQTQDFPRLHATANGSISPRERDGRTSELVSCGRCWARGHGTRCSRRQKS